MLRAVGNRASRLLPRGCVAEAVGGTWQAVGCSKPFSVHSSQHVDTGSSEKSARSNPVTDNDDVLTKERKGFDDGSNSLEQPLYAFSRASSRPKPNIRSPLYTSTSKRKRESPQKERARQPNVAQSSSEQKSGVDEVTGLAVEDHEARMPDDDVLARTDRELRDLYRELSQQAGRSDLVKILQTCARIKNRLSDIAKERKMPKTPPPTIHVYYVLLRVLAARAQVEVAKSVLNDMREAGFVVDVEALNWLLRAQVLAGDEEGIYETLLEIGELPGEVKSRAEEEGEGEEAAKEGPLLSEATTRNWTSATYQHLFLHCQHTHNLEYALALLGSASHRSEKQSESSNPADESFLTLTLSPVTQLHIIYLAIHCREARLVSDLALWMERDVGMRRLDPRTWMSVLRSCSDDDWFPGVELAWQRAVIDGLLVPDEGLIISIVNCAARGRKPAFIEKVISHFFDSAAPIPLQEWHLAPLFEAYCARYEFIEAFESLNRMSKTTPHPIPQLTFGPLVRFASASESMLGRAYSALRKVGTDKGIHSGITTGALNAVIAAANRLNDPEMALRVYRLRKFLRCASKDPSSPYPTRSEHALTNYSAAEKKARFEEMDARGLDGRMHEFSKEDLENTVHANVDTFNELLNTCINNRDREMGQLLFRDLNDERHSNAIKPDSITYERAIILCLTEDNYDDAFAFLEECKRRSLAPTADTYEAIASRCRRANDDRWLVVAQEMINSNAKPSLRLQQWMQEAGVHPRDQSGG